MCLINSAIYRECLTEYLGYTLASCSNFYSFRNEADSARTDVFVVLDFAQPSLQE
jgi:hypothetical protein